MTSARFTAPWGKLLYFITTVGVFVLGSIIFGFLFAPEVPEAVKGLAALFSFVVLVACAWGAVRGYRLEGDTLVIERLLRDERISLDGLERVHHDRDLIKGALRVGNGGLFVFAGYFWSRKLGWFRLVGNDILGRAVLLEFADRKLMITPSHPHSFVEEARKRIR